jgi:DDT domain/ATP-utilising chromatin assembly and remodelling N-terminal/WSTF, HB1, Itc1p, MBD9 motif 1
VLWRRGEILLTYLQADGAREVEQAFPEALKGPVLRSVQFSTISRIDNLVDWVFDEFKKDYYPGEAVTVHVVTGERLTGVVRDKTRFGNKIQPDGTMSAPFVRYFVSLDNRPLEEAVVDDNHIVRDRKIFTKQILRSFIKKTVTREAWTGAPWIVKPEAAAIYHIDSRVPPHLRYENKIAEKKHNQALKKNGPGPDFDGMVGSFPGNTPRLPELKPAPKSHKSKQQQHGQVTKLKQQTLSFINPAPHPQQHPQFVVNSAPFPAHTFHTNGAHPVQYSNFHNSTFAFPPLQAVTPLPPPPPPVKYPIEDLQIAPRKDGVVRRPPIKYYSQDTPVPVENHPAKGNGVLMETVGPLLETWDTLNVYCEIFKLDSFTFDDFVEALEFTSEDAECELFVEIHCAALKLLVSSEPEGGKIEVQLPEMDSDGEDDDSGVEASAVPTPTPEPEPKPAIRTTRSSLAKAEAANMKAESARSASTEPKKLHRAAEMRAENDWVERLKKRDFKNGGWEVIVVGLLHQLSKNPQYEKSCEELLRHLAPLDQEPTPATAKEQYRRLDINLRVKVLQIICMLTAETKAIRGFMEECSEQMTSFRKEKITWQRDRKAA